VSGKNHAIHREILGSGATAPEKRAVKYTDQSAAFTKARETNPFYANINFSSAQATMRRLDKAYKAFFRRAKAKDGKPGFPRFKGRDRFDSFEFPSYGDGVRLNGTRLRVQAVRKEIKVILHRGVVGTIKTVTLKREADKWYVVFSCELPDVPILPTDKPPVGIDVGMLAANGFLVLHGHVSSWILGFEATQKPRMVS
jgi:putative transposase